MLFENSTVCPIHETSRARRNRACRLHRMGKYDDAAIEMFKEGVGVVEIARQLGCSRSTVSTALRKAGLTRKRGWRSSYVPFTPAPKHRRQHAYKMFRALDRSTSGEPIGEVMRRELDGFVNQLSERTWTYNDDRGFYWVPRKPEHDDRPLIEEKDL